MLTPNCNAKNPNRTLKVTPYLMEKFLKKQKKEK